jgi:hypothetical protein
MPLVLAGAVAACAVGDRISAETLLVEFEKSSWTHMSRDTDVRFWLATIAFSLGDADRAAALQDGPEPWTACGRHAHAHAQALVAEASTRRDEAAALYAEAAAGWAEWGSVPLRAYALVGLGNCAGDATALAEGLEIFAGLGATPVSAGVAETRQQQV